MPTFPAFEDAEPPPPTRRQRLVRSGVVLGVLALVGTAAFAASAGLDRGRKGGPSGVVPSAAPSAGASAARQPGRLDGILWYDSERLAVADPDGGRRQRISADFPTTQQRFLATVSPDGRHVVTDDGYVVALDSPGLATPTRAAPPDVPHAFASSSAWVDGGRVLALDVGGASGPGVALVTVATGELGVIGPHALPAGDPSGYAIAYAAGLRELPRTSGTPEDTFLETDRIELLRPRAFEAPRVLLRKADLMQLMGLPAGTAVGFAGLGFAPDGKHLWFSAVADTKDAGPYGPADRWAVGIVSRTGELRAFKALDPLHFPNQPVWSPGGDQLAFIDFANLSRLSRPAATLGVWSLAGGGQLGAPRRLEVPEGVQPFSHGHCMWKPDATYLLCGDERAWYVIAVAGGASSVAESVPGQPLAWVSPR